MQQCYHCGQLNDDLEEYCAYCGQAMYIQIEHGSDAKMDHLYADSIARELIDENTVFEDDFDEITKELLGQTDEEETNQPFIFDGEEFTFDENETEIDEYRDEKLLKIEEELKTKIRRNKKLESGMGLLIRNIDIILDDYNGPLIIMGEVTTNDKLDNKRVQLSAISYDENKKVLTKNNTIVKVDHGNYVNFTLTLDINIIETSIIIILPEKIQYDNIEPETETKEKKNPEITKTVNSIFIEQLADIERKVGMTITNTSVLIKSEHSIEIVGEIRIDNPEKHRDIKIAATCYDQNNNILATESKQINTKLFLGFDTLSVKIENIDITSIQRIRLYPTYL